MRPRSAKIAECMYKLLRVNKCCRCSANKFSAMAICFALLRNWHVTLDPLCVTVSSVLMEDEFRGTALPVGYVNDLGVDGFHKIIVFGFRKYLGFRLCVRLRKEMITFACHRHDEVRHQFIAAGITVKYLWVHLDLLSFRRQYHFLSVNDGCEFRA